MADNYEDLSWSGMLIVVLLIGTIIITCIFNTSYFLFCHRMFFSLLYKVHYTE